MMKGVMGEVRIQHNLIFGENSSVSHKVTQTTDKYLENYDYTCGFWFLVFFFLKGKSSNLPFRKKNKVHKYSYIFTTNNILSYLFLFPKACIHSFLLGILGKSSNKPFLHEIVVPLDIFSKKDSIYSAPCPKRRQFQVGKTLLEKSLIFSLYLSSFSNDCVNKNAQTALEVRAYSLAMQCPAPWAVHQGPFGLFSFSHSQEALAFSIA